MTTYRWTPGSRIPADAQAVGERLSVLRMEHGDNLRPEIVWRDAQAPDSPLHKCFEWDTEKAAAAYWDAQARVVLRTIRAVSVGPDNKERLQRVFVNVVEQVDGEARRGYVSVSRVLTSEEMRQQLIVEARKELMSFKRRYAEIVELVEIVDEALARVQQSLLDAGEAAA